MRIEAIMVVAGVVLIGYLAVKSEPVYPDAASIMTSTPKPRSDADKYKFAASECWKSYELRSNTPMDKARIAEFCEGLEKRAK